MRNGAGRALPELSDALARAGIGVLVADPSHPRRRRLPRFRSFTPTLIFTLGLGLTAWAVISFGIDPVQAVAHGTQCAEGASDCRPNDTLGAGSAGEPDAFRCNGFAELCDRRVDQVVFAGSHNAMAAGALGWTWPNQDGAIRAQLEYGVRAFLIDTHYWEDSSRWASYKLSLPAGDQSAAQKLAARGLTPVGPYLCHMWCTLGAISLADGLRSFKSFLETHPNEVVILDIEDYVSTADTQEAFQASGLINDVYAHVPGTPWPTLRELIAHDRRVIVGAEHGGEPGSWYGRFYNEAWDTPFNFKSASEFNCSVYRGKQSNALLLMNHWLVKRVPDPADAAQVNRLDVLLARAHQCEAELGKRPNIVAVNFYATGDLLKAVDTLNGVAR